MNQPQEKLEGAPLIAPSTTDHPLYDDVVMACRTVFDPEIPVNVVDLGLVYSVELKPLATGGSRAEVKMTLTAPGCGMGPTIQADARNKVLSVAGVKEAEVELVWEPAWTQSMISEVGKMKMGWV